MPARPTHQPHNAPDAHDAPVRADDRPQCRTIRVRGWAGVSVDVVVSSESQALSCGVRIHAPDLDVTTPPRPVERADLIAVAEFCEQAVTHEIPEITLPALSLHRPGWVLDVVGSSPQAITLEWRVLDDSENEAIEFETSRLALLHAAAQFRGEPSVSRLQHRLFNDEAEPAFFQALLWDAIGLPSNSLLNGVSLPDRPVDDEALPAGEVAVLRGYSFAPGCDAEVELEQLRQRMPGAPAAVLGTYPDGERFGVVLLSHPDLDEATDDQVLAAADRLTRAAESAAVFALLDGGVAVTRADIEHHVTQAYPDAAGAEVGLALELEPMAQLLRALLAEAVGVPLPRVLTARDCSLSGWEHSCQGDPVEDALAAWTEHLVAPEAFLQFAAHEAFSRAGSDEGSSGLRHADATSVRTSGENGLADPTLDEGDPEQECAGEPLGGFGARFAEHLGSPATAPPPIARLFELAREADAAYDRGDDAQLLADLQAAADRCAELLAAGPPAGYRTGVHELHAQLSDIFRDFGDDDEGDAEATP